MSDTDFPCLTVFRYTCRPFKPQEAEMKKTAVILTFASIFLVSLVAQPQVPTRKDPDWAFAVINGALPAEPAGPRTFQEAPEPFQVPDRST
jgi:hypothetical protein